MPVVMGTAEVFSSAGSIGFSDHPTIIAVGISGKPVHAALALKLIPIVGEIVIEDHGIIRRTYLAAHSDVLIVFGQGGAYSPRINDLGE